MLKTVYGVNLRQRGRSNVRLEFEFKDQRAEFLKAVNRSSVTVSIELFQYKK